MIQLFLGVIIKINHITRVDINSNSITGADTNINHITGVVMSIQHITGADMMNIQTVSCDASLIGFSTLLLLLLAVLQVDVVNSSSFHRSSTIFEM